MTTILEDAALMELRIKLYGAAQLLKGDALEELKQLVREIVMVLDIDKPTSIAALMPAPGV